MDVARYHFLCAGHGACGSVPIEPTRAPMTRKCPVCGGPTEVWVGAPLPARHGDGEPRAPAGPRTA